MFSLLALVVSELYATSSHPQAAKVSEDVRTKFVGSLDRKTMDTIPRLSLNDNDNLFYQQQLLHRPNTLPPLKKKRARNSKDLLSNAYVTVRAALETWLAPRDPTDLERFLEALDRITVIEITVETESAAYLIFETINDRGLELSTADLVKNFLFSRVGETNIETVQSAWQSVNNLVGEFRITKFLRHYWISKYKLVRERYLFDAIKDEFGSKRQKVLRLLSDIQNEAETYAAFQLPEHTLWNDYKTARRHIDALRLFKAEQCYPLLLAAHACFKKSQFESVVRLIMILSFRYTEICTRGTANLESLYSRIAIAIRNGNIRTIPEVMKELRTMYPSDVDFEQSFRMKSASPSVARYILWEIERELGGKTLYSENHIIEHVFPKRPAATPKWPYQEYVSRLGNLTLLPKDENKKLKNKPPLEKTKAYPSTKLKINQYWKSKRSSKWEAGEIEQRQEVLSKVALKAWTF